MNIILRLRDKMSYLYPGVYLYFFPNKAADQVTSKHNQNPSVNLSA